MKTCLLLSLLLHLSSCFAYKKYYYYSSSSASPTQEEALRKAYYAQVDLIRRGLPTIVVQAEYAYAVNALCRSDRYFREKSKLSSFRILTRVWKALFDPNYYGRYAIKYIDYLKTWKPNINFLTFSKFQSLPALTPAQQAIIDTHWATTYSRIKTAPRTFFSYTMFTFPQNIEILHDPQKDQACAEYNKFGPVSSANAMNARILLISTFVSTIEICRMGGKKKALAQLFRHMVGYIFNGVRCTRREGVGVQIPLKLQKFYTSYLAYLYADIVKPIEVPLITKEAVEDVYEGEISALSSYNSWGNVEYAKLQTGNSIPRVYNAVDTILTDDSKHGEVATASARQLVRQGLISPTNLFNSSGHSFAFRNSTYPLPYHERLSNFTDRTSTPTCSGDFYYSPRDVAVEHIDEHCCATPCQIWGEVAGIAAGTPFDECCTRCNQYKCPITAPEDMANIELTVITIPEFGEQESYNMRLVLL